jgi:hypothetical protein
LSSPMLSLFVVDDSSSSTIMLTCRSNDATAEGILSLTDPAEYGRYPHGVALLKTLFPDSNKPGSILLLLLLLLLTITSRWAVEKFSPDVNLVYSCA